MYKLKTYKNGLQALIVPMKGTQTVTALIMIGTGSKYENAKNSGISHFLEHMFFKGTAKYPTALDLSSALDSLGAEYNAFTSKEFTGYWIKADKKKISKAMEILSEMILNLKLDPAEIEREKGVIIEELNMYLDNPLMYIEDVFEQCLYGNTPAGRDIIGTKETISSFKYNDFQSYLSAQYGPKNTVVCLAGNINGKEAEKLIERNFIKEKLDKRGRNFKEKERVVQSQKAPQIKLHYKKTDQAHLYLGVRSADYADKDKLAIKLLSIILGGSMSSRLFINLREREGLAYYVHTLTEAHSDAGYLATRAGVPVDKQKRAIEIILNEYKKTMKEPVGKDELKRAKDILRGRLVIKLEGSDDTASFFTQQAVMLNTIKRTDQKNKDQIIDPQKYMKMIEKITSVDIKKAANRIFKNENLNLAIIGPNKDKKEFEKIFSL